MIKVEKIETFNFESAIRGMRNPLNSWDKNDSIKCYANRNCSGICKNNACGLCIGENDLDLMRRLYKAGPEHRKYLRQIFVSMDITAPLYWWKEADQYKIGTTTNSCSTMHKITSKKFTIDDFSHEHIDGMYVEDCMKMVVDYLNAAREFYLSSKDKKFWWQLIQLLPSSYNQKRTITMNYETVISIIKQRTNHKLDEWNDLVKIFMTLPYVEDILRE